MQRKDEPILTETTPETSAYCFTSFVFHECTKDPS